MSILKRLFKHKEKEVFVPTKSEIMECPSCHSQDVAAQFGDADSDCKEVGNEGNAMKFKNVCQACGHIWGETEIDASELCLLPKHFNV
ncbi:MAG: hypothetical protein WC459_04015 [Patescibacteria group bacterium]